jgi:hypothetical protein
MARRDFDDFGEPFANISNRVAAGGAPDDVMVVQGLLQLHWQFSAAAQRLVPTKPPVDGAAHKSNTILISQFQKDIMGRAKPEGFVNPATRFDEKSLSFSTISALNDRANSILTVLQTHENSVEFLIANFPKLAGPLGGPRGFRRSTGEDDLSPRESSEPPGFRVHVTR